MLASLRRPPSFRQLEPWQRNQYVVILTVALAHVAFDLTQPFIPLYIRTLGVTDLAEASYWSGLVVGITPFVGALMGPVWGMVADRYGRKPMVLRALLTIGAMQVAMAYVPDIYWLFAARVFMGFFAGFTPAAMALAISLGPREKMGQAVGLVQAAQFIPLAIGPTIGGFISDLYGLRFNFVITGVMLMVPAILMFFVVQETGFSDPAQRAERAAQRKRGASFRVLAIPGFASALAVVFLSRFTDRSLPPIIPLYLVEIGTPEMQIATISGFVVAVGAIAAAISSVLYGRWAREENTRRLLLMGLVSGAGCSALLAISANWVQVATLRVILGLLAGGTMSLAFTMGARMVPASQSGVTLSVLSSGGQIGGALSPMLAGVIGQVDLRYAFLTNAAAYVVALMIIRTRRPQPPSDDGEPG